MTDGIKRHITQCEFEHKELVLMSLCAAIGVSVLQNDLHSVMHGMHILQHGEEDFGPTMESLARKLETMLSVDPRWQALQKEFLGQEGGLPS